MTDQGVAAGPNRQSWPSKAQPDGAAGRPSTITMSRTAVADPRGCPQPGHTTPWATPAPTWPGSQRAPWTPAIRAPG